MLTLLARAHALTLGVAALYHARAAGAFAQGLHFKEKNMGHIIWMGIVGLVSGGIAAFLHPGKENLGFFGVMLLGVAGSYVGGFIGNMIFKPKEGQSILSPGGFVMSILGALILLIGSNFFLK